MLTLLIGLAIGAGALCIGRELSSSPVLPGLRVTETDAGSQQYRVVTVDLSQATLRTVWCNADGLPLRNFRAADAVAKAAGQPLLFATNAGIFSDRRAPLGLYVEKGRELTARNLSDGRGNFFLKPNGIFWLKGEHAGIVNAEKYHPQAMPDFAVQSGPLLIDAGTIHPAFRADSRNRTIRSGVGTSASGRVIFVLSKSPVTFFEFAQFFRDDLHCRDALYLDGTISRMYVRGRDSLTDTDNFAAMFTVSSAANR